jgi:GNAT superfamily N-acetyltransferase
LNDAAAIRLLTPADVPQAFELSSLAGWNQTADDWSLLLKLAPVGCFGIQIGNILAATASLFCYERSLAWIGMVLTHPDFRRQGLATRLLRHVLAIADKVAIRTLKLDATEMGEPLYRSLGFLPEQTVERWMRSATFASDSELTCSRDLSPLAETIDRAVFGGDRAFLLRALLQQGACYSISGSYLLTRSGRNASYLGPWVGREKRTARQLLELGLRTPSANGWYWDILLENHDAVALAKEFGFSPQRRLLRMSRGEPFGGRDEFIYAIAGFEFG